MSFVEHNVEILSSVTLCEVCEIEKCTLVKQSVLRGAHMHEKLVFIENTGEAGQYFGACEATFGIENQGLVVLRERKYFQHL